MANASSHTIICRPAPLETGRAAGRKPASADAAPHSSVQPSSGNYAPDPTPDWMTDKGSSAGDGAGTGLGAGTGVVQQSHRNPGSGTNPVTGINAGTGVGKEDISAHGRVTESAIGGSGSDIDSDRHGVLINGSCGRK